MSDRATETPRVSRLSLVQAKAALSETGKVASRLTMITLAQVRALESRVEKPWGYRSAYGGKRDDRESASLEKTRAELVRTIEELRRDQARIRAGHTACLGTAELDRGRYPDSDRIRRRWSPPFDLFRGSESRARAGSRARVLAENRPCPSRHLRR
jgi:hypothetical protein